METTFDSGYKPGDSLSVRTGAVHTVYDVFKLWHSSRFNSNRQNGHTAHRDFPNIIPMDRF